MLHSIVKVFVITTLFFCAFQVSAQVDRGAASRTAVSQTVSNLNNSLRNADLDALSEYIGESVDISLPAKQGHYSKAQAKYVLKEFFTNNPPKEVQVDYSDNIAESEIATFTYISTRGKYDTKVTIKASPDGRKISEIRFESKN